MAPRVFFVKKEQILGDIKFLLRILKSFLFLWVICDGLGGDADCSVLGL